MHKYFISVVVGIVHLVPGGVCTVMTLNCGSKFSKMAAEASYKSVSIPLSFHHQFESF